MASTSFWRTNQDQTLYPHSPSGRPAPSTPKHYLGTFSNTFSIETPGHGGGANAPPPKKISCIKRPVRGHIINGPCPPQLGI